MTPSWFMLSCINCAITKWHSSPPATIIFGQKVGDINYRLDYMKTRSISIAGPHKINNFVMMEKSAKPIFLNHE